MWGANAWATVPWAVASATATTATGLVTLTTTARNALAVSDARQNTLVLSAVKIGSVAISEGQ